MDRRDGVLAAFLARKSQNWLKGRSGTSRMPIGCVREFSNALFCVMSLPTRTFARRNEQLAGDLK